jgi:RNA polymerase sigma factor (TIGR02999 family)
MGDITQILAALAAGLPGSTDALAELVYAELRQLAGHKLALLPPGQTLQPTALVHEAWLRLFGGAEPSFATRAQFFAAAAQGMRNILIDRARRKQSLKRGSGGIQLFLSPWNLALIVWGTPAHALRMNSGSNGIVKIRPNRSWPLSRTLCAASIAYGLL